jgi:hypothetical protein
VVNPDAPNYAVLSEINNLDVGFPKLLASAIRVWDPALGVPHTSTAFQLATQQIPRACTHK